jgi:hypothetical protein
VEWSLWLDRPLMGQWVDDIREATRERPGRLSWKDVVLIGWREAGLAALLAAALDERFGGAAAIESPASFITDSPPHNQRMVIFTPNLLKAGDMPHLAALAAPRPVLIANPVFLDGAAATAAQAEALHRWPRDLYRLLGRPDRFHARGQMGEAEVVEIVRGFSIERG